MFSLTVGETALAIRHLRRGVFMFSDGVATSEECSLDRLAALVRERLGVVQGERSSLSVAVGGDGTTGRITREEGLTGFRMRLTRDAIDYDIGIATFEAALSELLSGVSLWPENIPRNRPDLSVDSKFSFESFVAHAEPQRLARGSWDDSGDASVWGSDYVTPRAGAGLQLSAHYPPFAVSTVTAEFQRP